MRLDIEQLLSYDTIIFDLYGTLIDIRTNESNPYLWRKTAEFYTLKGAPWIGPELRKAYHAFVRDEIISCRKKLPDEPENLIEPDIGNVFRRLYEAKNVSPSEAEIEDTAILFRALSTRKLTLYSDTIPMLEKLKSAGRRIELLSNAQALFTLPEMNSLGLTSYFEHIFISSAEGIKKPSPRFFRILLDRCDLAPAHCVMVGNDPVSDISGAQAVGLPAILISDESD